MEVMLLPPLTPRTPLKPPPTAALPETPSSLASPRTEAAPVTRREAPTSDAWRVDASEAPEAGAARATLRARLGCATADLLALTKAERAACQEALAKGLADAPTYAVVSPKLRKVFEGTFECPKGDVWCEYRIGKAPYPGLLAPRKPPRDRSWD